MLNIKDNIIEEIKEEINIINNNKELKPINKVNSLLSTLNPLYEILLEKYKDDIDLHIQTINNIFNIEISKPKYKQHLKKYFKESYDKIILNIEPALEKEKVEKIEEIELDQNLIQNNTYESTIKEDIEKVEEHNELVDQINSLKKERNSLKSNIIKQDKKNNLMNLSIALITFSSLIFILYKIL